MGGARCVVQVGNGGATLRGPSWEWGGHAAWVKPGVGVAACGYRHIDHEEPRATGDAWGDDESREHALGRRAVKAARDVHALVQPPDLVQEEARRLDDGDHLAVRALEADWQRAVLAAIDAQRDVQRLRVEGEII